MQSIASGTAQSPAPILTRVEPSGSVSLGVANSGSQNEHTFIFQNTGNVPQTLTMGEITNISNCSIYNIFFMRGSTPIQGDSVIVEPGEIIKYKVVVTVSNMSPGSPDQPFSYEVNWYWN